MAQTFYEHIRHSRRFPCLHFPNKDPVGNPTGSNKYFYQYLILTDVSSSHTAIQSDFRVDRDQRRAHTAYHRNQRSC